jgi:addiction module HigA family antidote
VPRYHSRKDNYRGNFHIFLSVPVQFVCARPVHPGEILKEEIEYRGISQSKLAAQMDISYNELNQILNERRSLTSQTAMMFEAALGISANLLISMQTDSDIQVLSRDKSFSEKLDKIRKAVAMP